MDIMKFGHYSLITWTVTGLKQERQEMDDWDYECIICGHRITVPLGQKTPPTKCENCGHEWCYYTKKTIEENERINAEES